MAISGYAGGVLSCGPSTSSGHPGVLTRCRTTWTAVRVRRAAEMKWDDDAGVALVVTITTMGLLLALGTMLLLITMTETGVAANYRDGIEALYAAEAGIERVLPDVAAVSDWDFMLAGITHSTFIDGPPGGVRRIGGGAALNLSDATRELRCGAFSTCTESEMDAVTAERPWGKNNPRWQLLGYGPLAAVLPPGELDSHMYVLVWIADDPSENDGNPLRDGQPPAVADSRNPDNPGRGVVVLLAHAYGPAGARRVVEATIARTGGERMPGLAKVRILAWREVR